MYVVFCIQISHSCFSGVYLDVCRFFAIIWGCLYLASFPGIDLGIWGYLARIFFFLNKRKKGPPNGTPPYLAIILNLAYVFCQCYVRVLISFKIVIGRCTCLDKSVSKTQILSHKKKLRFCSVFLEGETNLNSSSLFSTRP